MNDGGDKMLISPIIHLSRPSFSFFIHFLFSDFNFYIHSHVIHSIDRPITSFALLRRLWDTKAESVNSLLFLCFCGLWPHCSLPNALVTQILPLPTRTGLR